MGNPIRVGKMHLAAHGYDAAGGIASYGFDSLSTEIIQAFNAAIAASQANTVVVWAVTLPQRCEIQKIWLNLSTGAGYNPAADKFNLVVGTGAESGVSGSAFTVQAAGNSVFATDKLMGGAASTNWQVLGPFYPDVMTAWYDTGTNLTLRIVTDATAGTHINANGISVSLCMCLVDALPAKQDAGLVTAPNF